MTLVLSHCTPIKLQGIDSYTTTFITCENDNIESGYSVDSLFYTVLHVFNVAKCHEDVKLQNHESVSELLRKFYMYFINIKIKVSIKVYFASGDPC